MLLPLSEATPSSCGGKAATLGLLLRSGLPVPDGVVVTWDRIDDDEGPATAPSTLTRELERLGAPMLAVRSSAADEDTPVASAAGQYESIIGVRGEAEVRAAVARCRASAHAARAVEYRNRRTGGRAGSARTPHMAVLVQRVIEAGAAGVMFTPQLPEQPLRIEASWGLGISVVDGTVGPDSYEVTSDGSVQVSIGRKQTRTDLGASGGVVTSAVAPHLSVARALNDDAARRLAALGRRIASLLGGPQDIEWAVAEGAVWILQARPVTAVLPARPDAGARRAGRTLTGTPGSHGTVTATARIIGDPSDFGRAQRGDVVVCPYTDPAWTPLFAIAAGVVTETGGALSHAAIVAREYGIPAVLGVPEATTRIADGAQITLDGSAGAVDL